MKNTIKKIIIASLIICTGVSGTSIAAETDPIAGSISMMHGVKNDEAEKIKTSVSAGASNIIFGVKEKEDYSDKEAVPIKVDVIAEATKNIDYDHLAVADVDGYVNVRSEPSEESEVLGKLYDEGVGKVIEKKDGWVHIQSGSVDGYVKSEYVSIGNKDIIDAAAKCVAKVTASALKVRSGMSTDSSVIEVVTEGEKLIVSENTTVDPAWIPVKTDESDAYVSGDYVEVLFDFTYAESKEEEAARLERAAINNGVAVANFGLQFVGNRYVWGGTSLTSGADCSGFVMSVFANFGIYMPHSSYAQRSVGYGVPVNEMRAGDIVCYNGHVGICIGDGMLVHASSPTSGIKVSSAYYRNIVAVRRVF